MFLSNDVAMWFFIYLSYLKGPIETCKRYMIKFLKTSYFLGNWWNSHDCFDGDHAMLNATSMIHHNNTKTPVEEYWK